jgi:hypothetical protein
MYSNIGKKIMTLATIIATVTMALSCGFGIYLLVEGATATGILIMVFGPIVCWISGFFLYGFGRLIDNSDYIAFKMGRRDGYGIPDVSRMLDWSNPEDDDVDESVPAPQFVAQRVVYENKDAETAFCSVCGSKTEKGSAFCTKCGNKVN